MLVYVIVVLSVWALLSVLLVGCAVLEACADGDGSGAALGGCSLLMLAATVLAIVFAGRLL